MSMSLNIVPFGSGAKAMRLAKLQESGVMDMQIEKFTNLFPRAAQWTGIDACWLSASAHSSVRCPLKTRVAV